jgi:hypothetical protein
MLPAALLAVVYLIWAPPSADLAAQTFRTELFEADGFEVWSNAWYGGIHFPGYSLLFPPLASVLGIRLVGAISVVFAAGLFAMLVRPHYGDRARLAIWLFGLGAATNLFTGRLTFALGVAIGIGGLLALDRGRPVVAAVLAALTACASPVAGLFLAFAGGVLVVTGRRRDGLVLGAAALGATGLVALAFPTGGVEPFAGNTFTLITAATLILVFVVPRTESRLRLAAVLYVVMCFVLFAIDTPIGGNATRLGALMAAPLLALGAWGRRPAWLVGLALLPLIYWQWVAPVRDLTDAVGEPSVEAAYYAPLLAELDRRAPSEPFRVQVPPTRNRWEANYVGARFPLARGWLRQAESDDFDLFQDGNLTADSYRAWLDERAVAFVALSLGAEPDYLSEDEIDLVQAGLPYLEEVWSNDDWELYEVTDPAPLAPVPATLANNGFAITPTGLGTFPVAVRFSPYYRVIEGRACVRERGDWSAVEVYDTGTVRIEAELGLAELGGALAGDDRVCFDD